MGIHWERRYLRVSVKDRVGKSYQEPWMSTFMSSGLFCLVLLLIFHNRKQEAAGGVVGGGGARNHVTVYQ